MSRRKWPNGEPPDVRVLKALVGQGSEMTVLTLSAATYASDTTVRRAVRRLHRKGQVAIRRPSGSDFMLIRATHKGKALT